MSKIKLSALIVSIAAFAAAAGVVALRPAPAVMPAGCDCGSCVAGCMCCNDGPCTCDACGCDCGSGDCCADGCCETAAACCALGDA